MIKKSLHLLSNQIKTFFNFELAICKIKHKNITFRFLVHRCDFSQKENSSGK